MTYSEKLRMAIANQDVIRARSEILVCLDYDSNTSTPTALKFAEEIADKFINPNDPFFDKEDRFIEIPTEDVKWTPVLFKKLKAALQINFSREKLTLAENMIQVLRRRGIPEFQVQMRRTGTVDHTNEKKNTSLLEKQRNTSFPGTTKGTACCRKSTRKSRNEFLAGAIVGAATLGGAGLIVGLMAECAIKMTLGGILVGGIAGGILNQRKNR